MSGRTVVQVYFPEDPSGGSSAKTVLLVPEDSTETLIEKINNKLRVESGAGILSIKPNNGEEITLSAGDSPFEVWSKYGADGCQVWFRPRDVDGGAGAKQWDDFDDFGFGSLRMMEANETADQFDELLSQLRIDEMAPVDVQEADATVDTDNLPHCSSCGGPIAGQVLIAFNMPWHPEHLGCAVCGTPFTGGKRVMEGEDGNAYCERDFIDTFAVKCGKCSEPIIGECVNALGVGYHPEHFCCEMCKTTLEGAFFEHEGGIYCEQHYYKMLGLLCPECEKPIFGKCVNARGVRYHPDHFKCEFCKKPLAGLAFYVHNDRPYDKKCALKLFG